MVSDLLSDAAAWLDGVRQAHLVRPVVYQRGEAQVELSATVGSTNFRFDDAVGASVRVESRDYLIATEQLVIDGSMVVPQRGDRIVEDARVYEVAAPNGEPEWRYSDPARRTLRIHTRQIDIED